MSSSLVSPGVIWYRMLPYILHICSFIFVHFFFYFRSSYMQHLPAYSELTEGGRNSYCHILLVFVRALPQGAFTKFRSSSRHSFMLGAPLPTFAGTAGWRYTEAHLILSHILGFRSCAFSLIVWVAPLPCFIRHPCTRGRGQFCFACLVLYYSKSYVLAHLLYFPLLPRARASLPALVPAVPCTSVIHHLISLNLWHFFYLSPYHLITLNLAFFYLSPYHLITLNLAFFYLSPYHLITLNLAFLVL